MSNMLVFLAYEFAVGVGRGKKMSLAAAAFCVGLGSWSWRGMVGRGGIGNSLKDQNLAFPFPPSPSREDAA